MRLDDLNGDVLLNIFEELEFEDLINLAGTRSKLPGIIQYYAAFKLRINEKLIDIHTNKSGMYRRTDSNNEHSNF